MNASIALSAEFEDPRAARRATRLYFFVCGIVQAAWPPMVPFVKERLALDDSSLGLIVLALGAGAILAMPLTGLLMLRLGSRVVMALGGLLASLLVPLMVVMPSPVLMAAVLFLFGAFLAALDVSMNSHAVIVEAKGKRPIMSALHGLFSVGAGVGAFGMSGLLMLGVPLFWCTIVLATVGVLLVLTQFSALLPRADDMVSSGGGFRLPRGVAIWLGLMAFVCFLAEGSMFDWSAVYLRFSRDMSEGQAGLGFAAFSVAMAVMRLTGDRLTAKLGAETILRFGPVVGAAGLALALLAPFNSLAIVGFAILGIGVANVVPVLISTAGRLPNPAINVPAVMTLGYSGMLAGPVAIGFIADMTSLTAALAGVAVLLLFICTRAGLARG